MAASDQNNNNLTLAIECLLAQSSIAVAQDGVLIAAADVPGENQLSQTLIQFIRDFFANHDKSIKNIQRVIVSGGSGSLTGQRVGSAAGLGLALGSNAEYQTIDLHNKLSNQIAPVFFQTDGYVLAITKEQFLWSPNLENDRQLLQTAAQYLPPLVGKIEDFKSYLRLSGISEMAKHHEKTFITDKHTFQKITGNDFGLLESINLKQFEQPIAAYLLK